jgi:hypothetical protein
LDLGFFTLEELGFRLDKSVDVFVIHSIFRPNFSPTTVTRNETIKCNEADAYKSNMRNLTSLIGNSEDSICTYNNIYFELNRKYRAPINKHMHSRIVICKNSTSNNNKYFSEKIIRQKLSSLFVSFLYKDSYIDGTYYFDPVKNKVTSNTLKSSSCNYRRDVHLFKNISF